MSRAVIIDGVRYEMISDAARAIDANEGSVRTNLSRGKSTYKNHSIAYAEEVDKVVQSWRTKNPHPYVERVHVPGTPLLMRHVTHRLGAYVGGWF
jgi:hypothetical protein